ncbi:MAG: hypothetical protein PVS3B3_11470 [Ktedonobacteraceae bacterium]
MKEDHKNSFIVTTKGVGQVECKRGIHSKYSTTKEWVVSTHSCTYLDGLPMQERNTIHSETTLMASIYISEKLGTY